MKEYIYLKMRQKYWYRIDHPTWVYLYGKDVSLVAVLLKLS